MGNGVDRIERPSLVPVGEARDLSESGDWAPMMFPHPIRLFEAGLAALDSLGVSTDGVERFVTDAVVRLVDDDTVEVICWRKG